MSPEFYVSFCLILTAVLFFFLILWGLKGRDWYHSYRAYYYATQSKKDGGVVNVKPKTLDERELLAKKFLFLSKLKEDWSGFHVRKHTDNIYNGKENHFGTKNTFAACISLPRFEFPFGGSHYCGYCPIAEYFGECNKARNKVRSSAELNNVRINSAEGMDNRAAEIIDDVEAFLKVKYTHIINDKTELSEVDRILLEQEF